MQDTDGCRSLANAAFAEGRYEDALQLFTSLIACSGDPPDHVMLCNRAAVLLKLGRVAEACDDAELAVRHAPPSRAVKAHYRYACALHAGGAHADAILSIDIALGQSPENSQLLALRQQCEAVLRQRGGAPLSPQRGAARARQSDGAMASKGMRVVSRRLPPTATFPGASPLMRTGSGDGGDGSTAARASDLNSCRSPSAPNTHLLACNASPSAVPCLPLRRPWLLDIGSQLLLRPREWLPWISGWLACARGWLARRLSTSWLGSRSVLALATHTREADDTDAYVARTAVAGCASAGVASETAGSEGIGRLPPEILHTCMEPLQLLQVLNARCVCRSWASIARGVLACRTSQLIPGTYEVTVSRHAAHPSMIWDDDTVVVEGAGTLTLHDNGTLSGRLEEVLPSAPTLHPPAPSRSAPEPCVGVWHDDGFVELTWAEGIGLRLAPHQRHTRLTFELRLSAAEVSCAVQWWRLKGHCAGRQYLAAEHLSPFAAPPNDISTNLQMDLRLLY